MFANESRLAKLLRKAGRLPPRSSIANAAIALLKAHRAAQGFESEAKEQGVVTEVAEGTAIQSGPQLFGEGGEEGTDIHAHQIKYGI